ncbi:response regulator [Variovorax ginsengisoli]|uniref:Response regulator n=1 Tax=Variovorax ginsengisoli TaxID=363844 RepID=A0ABT8SGQ5_9BURK|nr:response regulator [Variovorax ginsengisoli]MDN8618936.1 response regulator [Variovorax ginsengisoli]MDO1538106.1 response regulator [Variovorax ginsengisoli]
MTVTSYPRISEALTHAGTIRPSLTSTKNKTVNAMAGLSVFLVEDNQKIRDHLIPALADLGSASVIAIAQSEREAIAWLAHHKGKWDLAVVDLFLEEGNGLGVVDWCRGREPHQRVAVLTNYATQAMRKACLEAGADAFFDKSTELEAFFEFCLDRA